MKPVPKQTIYDKPGPILDIAGMGVTFQGTFSQKGHFICLHSLNKSFLTISMKIFFIKKYQGARFGAKDTPNKGLEQFL